MGKGRFCREFAVKTNKIMDLNTVKTVVVKIGTSTLTYENGKMNRNLEQVEGSLLVVSQFTLQASTRKGNRPSYVRAAPEAVSRPMYERFTARVAELLGREVPTGEFGADMQVALVNDGPVTIWIDSKMRDC